jgi:hypothetical protein
LGFDLDPVEVELEKKVKAAKVRGNIDAFFKSTIFEFKTNIEIERPAAIIELEKYFQSRSNPSDYMGLLTDGLKFEVYQLENEQLTKIAEFKLSEDDPLVAFRYLDQFIFSSKPVKPDSDDITQRFGLHSAVFNSCRQLLERMYGEVKTLSTIGVKIREWKTLLARVYGSDFGDVGLFIRHTYLTMFSRLLVARTLYPNEVRKTNDYRGLLTGEYFSRKNLPNLVEPDFFSWALDTDQEKNFIGFLSKLEQYLSIYELGDVTEDVLKQLYQELVDPESRHSLAEYYTPDWLAELTIGAIPYKQGRFLDPSCGSGTFLFSAVKWKRQQGLTGKRLLEDSLSSLIGIDVHPLAIMMAKANLLIALNKEIKTYKKDIYFQIYLSDTLLMAEDIKTRCINIPVSKSESFLIPLETIERKRNLDKLIDTLSSFAHRVAEGIKLSDAFEGLQKKALEGFSDREMFFWRQNLKLLANLIKNKRDSIWPFILKNAYRPVYLRLDKVNYIVGNPPWLSYRFIRDAAYKSRVKELTFELGLLSKKDVKLFTQMDTSTVFFRYCEREFLKPKGIIALVMPKTTILPSKQHILFQKEGISEIHDFSKISPLFNVRSVVLVNRPGNSLTSNIPITYYEGKEELPYKNMELKAAKKYFNTDKGTHNFLGNLVESPYYYERFFQGATLVPRCLFFVQPAVDAAKNEDAPFLETSEEAKSEAKKPWILTQEGRVENEFLFGTVLAKGLLPFAISRRELVFLPIGTKEAGALMIDSAQLLSEGKEFAAEWMQKAEQIWNERRSSEERTIYQRLNYNNLLTIQNTAAKAVVLYNTSGTNLAAALSIPTEEIKFINVHGFVADAKTYYYYPKNKQEGDYLCAMLNSEIVNEFIKAFQPQGLYGPRDIHRRPFEVCAIPPFSETDPQHVRLSELGKECRVFMKNIAPKMRGTVGRVRTETRHILGRQLNEINKIVKSILHKHGQDKPVAVLRKKKETTPTLFELSAK